MASSTPAVYGVRQTMAELRALEPKLRTQAIKDVKAAARPLEQGVQSRMPGEPPLSGFAHKGRTGWTSSGRRVRTKFGGRKGSGTEWPLLSVIVSGASASIYDMAGRGSGSQLASALSGRHGKPSRAAWPGAEANLSAVQASVLAAITKVQQQANPKLATITKGA